MEATTERSDVECPVCGEVVDELIEYELEEMCQECRRREEEELAAREARLEEGFVAMQEQHIRGTLVQELIKHIDHDEPPGLGARELASFILQVTAGLGGKEALVLLGVFKEAVARRRPGPPERPDPLIDSDAIGKVSQLLAEQPPPTADEVEGAEGMGLRRCPSCGIGLTSTDTCYYC